MKSKSSSVRTCFPFLQPIFAQLKDQCLKSYKEQIQKEDYNFFQIENLKTLFYANLLQGHDSDLRRKNNCKKNKLSAKLSTEK